MLQNFIFTMTDLRKVAHGREILKGIHVSFFPRAKIGVMGPNGAGKSTLLRIMAGVDKDFTGVARPDPQARIGYVPQEPQLEAHLTVRGHLERAFQSVRDLLTRFDEVSAQFAEPLSDDAMEKLLEEQGKLQDAIDLCHGWEWERMLDVAMDALRLPAADAQISQISGGEKRRVALCRVLLEKPDLLLLDEPTNHLDAESVAWLEAHLQAYPGTVVSVTHDRYFLDNVAEWILELDHGQGLPWKGNYSSWLEQKQKRLEVVEKTESARRKQLARELAWVRMSSKARQAKGKARLARYEELCKQGSDKGASAGGEIDIPPGPKLGGTVLVVENVSKNYGDRLLIEDLNFKVLRGAVVGVIGPNGAGKTTLFRMIQGKEPPTKGTLRLGESVKLTYVDQSRDALEGQRTVYEEVSGGLEFLDLGKKKVNARAYLASFAFKGTDQQKRVQDLSGGERNRVHLAKMLKEGGNFLLLDEPTNDLDVETLRSLEEALQSFAGCAMIISHDRWFLDRVATHILAFEGESKVFYFEGNFQDYEADKKKRLGAEALQPKRIKYKPLMRA